MCISPHISTLKAFISVTWSRPSRKELLHWRSLWFWNEWGPTPPLLKCKIKTTITEGCIRVTRWHYPAHKCSEKKKNYLDLILKAVSSLLRVGTFRVFLVGRRWMVGEMSTIKGEKRRSLELLYFRKKYAKINMLCTCTVADCRVNLPLWEGQQRQRLQSPTHKGGIWSTQGWSFHCCYI